MDFDTNDIISWNDFVKVDMRIGTIINVENLKNSKKPAYKMLIDFGELGIKKTSAQITKLYKPQDLIGRQIVAVVNFPKKQISNFMSECLVLGGLGNKKEVTIISPERRVKNGTKIA